MPWRVEWFLSLIFPLFNPAYFRRLSTVVEDIPKSIAILSHPILYLFLISITLLFISSLIFLRVFWSFTFWQKPLYLFFHIFLKPAVYFPIFCAVVHTPLMLFFQFPCNMGHLFTHKRCGRVLLCCFLLFSLLYCGIGSFHIYCDRCFCITQVELFLRKVYIHV